MRSQFDLLAENIRAECGRGAIYYFPNPGNWGDALIRYGTLKFFEDYNLSYREIKTGFNPSDMQRSKKEWVHRFVENGTVIYGGGGGWCQIFNHAEGHVKAHQVRLKYGGFQLQFKTIVMPSTYEKNYSIPDTIFFCRDVFESQQHMPDAIFCHDLAFYAAPPQSLTLEIGRGAGYFFRNDVGSSGKIKILQANRDISTEGNHISDVDDLFAAINQHAIIHTDRLHVAIPSCLLGKETHIYLGSYFKNRAVYNSSMKNYFDKVFFHNEFDNLS